MRQIFEGIFEEKGKQRLLYTQNLIRGSHFNEDIKTENGIEFRNWDARRSKLAAAIAKGMKEFPIKKGSTILYLGASHGVTPSYISDIIGSEGFIFAVEFSPRVARQLVYVSEARKNIAPILEDASRPENYKDKVVPCDILYQDIAQKNQVEIFVKNAESYLKKGGFGMLALKARSIDVTRKPGMIYDESRNILQKHFEIIDYKTLDPFEKDHAFFLVRKK